MVDDTAVPSANPPSIPAGRYAAVTDGLIRDAVTLRNGVWNYLGDAAAYAQAEALVQTLQEIRRRYGV